MPESPAPTMTTSKYSLLTRGLAHAPDGRPAGLIFQVDLRLHDNVPTGTIVRVAAKVEIVRNRQLCVIIKFCARHTQLDAA
jgi:hypothetical protein